MTPPPGYDRPVALDDTTLERVLDELGLSLDITAKGHSIAPLVDLLAQGVSREETGQAAAHAAAETWDSGVASEVLARLEELRAEYRERMEAIDAIAAETSRPAAENAVALALVVRAAIELWARARRNYSVVAVLEDELEVTPPAGHRGLALSIAAATIPMIALDGAEVDAAVTRFLDDRDAAWLARTLATDERRSSMRRALAHLADAAGEEFPLAVGAMRSLLDEPQPGDPADDDLWVSLVVGLAQAHLDFEPG